MNPAPTVTRFQSSSPPQPAPEQLVELAELKQQLQQAAATREAERGEGAITIVAMQVVKLGDSV